MNWVQGRRSPQGISPGQKSPALGKSRPAQGTGHPPSSPQHPSRPAAKTGLSWRRWDYWRGGAAGARFLARYTPISASPSRISLLSSRLRFPAWKPQSERAPFRSAVPPRGQTRRPRGAQARRVGARAAALQEGRDRLPDAGLRCLAVPGSALPLAGPGPRSRLPSCAGAAHGAPGGAHAGGWPARGAGES